MKVQAVTQLTGHRGVSNLPWSEGTTGLNAFRFSLVFRFSVQWHTSGVPSSYGILAESGIQTSSADKPQL